VLILKHTKSASYLTVGLATATIPMRDDDDDDDDDDGVYYVTPHYSRDANGKTHSIYICPQPLTSIGVVQNPSPPHITISNQLNTHYCSLGHAHQIQSSIFETQLPCQPYPYHVHTPHHSLTYLHCINKQTTTTTT
jgi:hypothetical protein